MYALGIDIGYFAVKTVVTDPGNRIIHTAYTPHRGRIREALARDLAGPVKKFGPDAPWFGAVTGSGRHVLTGLVQEVNEVTAIVEGGAAAAPHARSIAEIGAQSAKYITGLAHVAGPGVKIAMNSNCSSGTGSFLEEQVSRLNLTLEDYSDLAAKAGTIPRIAGRCSVFAKTDITHHQQEGVPVEDILLGLAYSVVKNFRAGVMKKLAMEPPILLIGGVARNQGIIRALNDVLDLGHQDLVIPDHFDGMGAAGTAILARKQQLTTDIRALGDALADPGRDTRQTPVFSLPPLVSYGRDDSRGKHDIDTPARQNPECYLGVDVGSTSTNLVLCDAQNRIIGYRYLRTQGDPVTAVNQGLEDLRQAHGRDMTILGTCVTGSGRYMIARLLGTDMVKDEITAQAKAAVTLDPEVDTIFEIGGQDSKFIRITDKNVADFQMNKVCAAGTGSFIEEQAKKFDIPVDGFGEIALRSSHPVELGERCTVFIETTLAAHLSQGAKTEDLASGLCYAVVKNYLNRVVGRKKTGRKIVFQGGLAHNQGVVNAFRAVLGKRIEVPRFFSVTGAYGAAVLAREAVEAGNAGRNRVKTETEPANTAPPETNQFSRQVQDLVFKGYDGVCDPAKKTVGLPRALFTFGMFSMFHTFFKTLGFNVVMSDPSNEETIRLAQEYSLDETCFPVKLINGHAAQLVAQKVDYLFFPDLFTVSHPGSESRQNYGCAYMQAAFKIINQAMSLEKTGITLLAPTIAFNQGPEFMTQSFTALGKQLGRSKEETIRALQASMKAFQQFEHRLAEHGRHIISSISPDEKVFVLISKIYGVADPVLNMGIPDKLSAMGYKTISFFDLPEGNIFKEHPNMYWPFAQHMLDPAHLVRAHPNLYAILLTHHGCGPDSVVSHFFGEIMSPKPFLNIEVDEHSSSVGVMTRIEAFVNSLSQVPPRAAGPMEDYRAGISHAPVAITQGLPQPSPDLTLYLSHLFPYSEICLEYLLLAGYRARVLPETTQASLDRGRQQTVTNEYFSLAALLGDVLEACGREDHPENAAVFIPQTEGAEVDGQYSRFVRTKLDENGCKDTLVVSPFLEDLLTGDFQILEQVFLGLVAGDLVRLAPGPDREARLSDVIGLVREQGLTLDRLSAIARTISRDIAAARFKKQLLVVGDPLILFNDRLNTRHFSRLETLGHRVVLAPLSEYMLMLWQDFAAQNGRDNKAALQDRIDTLKHHLQEVDTALAGQGAFERDLDDLVPLADTTLGLYAGGNGRYRMAKCLGSRFAPDGIITAAPMYENTGISLGILQRNVNGNTPMLNLTFDGNENETDRTKIDAFLFYAGRRSN